jgi:Fe-coproporphyrin III synthase
MKAQHELVTLAHDVSPDVHRLTTLPVLVVHAHTSCNCRCLMCDIWKTAEHRSLRPEEMERHLESIRRLGVRWIVFTGGEPLLNPALASVCALLRPLGIRLTLLTTGLLLNKCAADAAKSFDEILLSLDGPESIHNSIRCVDNAFELIKAGVAAVKELNPAIRITARTTVQRSNCFYLRETVAAAKQLNLDGISFLAADVQSEAFNRPLVWPAERQNEIALSHSDLPALEAEIQGLIRDCAADIQSGYIAESPIKLYRILAHFRAHLGIEPPKAPICNAPWTSAVIETDGTVRPCFFHPPVGNIRHANLQDVVNSDKATRFRASLDIESNEICRRCVCSLNYRP